MSPEIFGAMTYWIIALVIVALVLSGFAISFRLYVKDRRMHRHSSSGRRRRPRNVPAYELSTWIDEEVAKDKLYRKPDISTIELADELGLDVLQLRSIIRKAHDKSVTEYLNERRIQAAGRLLWKQPNMTLEEISHEVGFTSLKTFVSVFKSTMGQTPEKYRETLHQRLNN